MIILKFLDGNFDPAIQECEDIVEAIDFDYKVWASLGENCDFYYNGHKLILDTTHWTKDVIMIEAKKQMKEWDKSIICKKVVKPPLGLEPKYIWNARRIQNIIEATNRYTDAGKVIPTEWIDEYNELVKQVEN